MDGGPLTEMHSCEASRSTDAKSINLFPESKSNEPVTPSLIEGLFEIRNIKGEILN